MYYYCYTSAKINGEEKKIQHEFSCSFRLKKCAENRIVVREPGEERSQHVTPCSWRPENGHTVELPMSSAYNGGILFIRFWQDPA
jgi:hypothetical protein